VESLHIRLEVDSNSPLYEVVMNDDGPDSGSNFSFYISGQLGGSTTFADIEAAVQAFATSISTETGHTLVAVKNVSVNQTTL